jgi:hypothetical protein
VIAFAQVYWDLDRGGAAARAYRPDRNPAFVFPKMQHPDYVAAARVPQFVEAGKLTGHQPRRLGPVHSSESWRQSLGQT